MVVLPEPFASIPRTTLLFEGPSPLHQLANLSRHVRATTSATGITLWAKREDCSSGLGLGGNKMRKLEYVMPSALDQGCDTLISTGGWQSNHLRQVAAVGSHLALKTILVPQQAASCRDDTGVANESFRRAGNVQLHGIMGAQVAVANTPLDQVASGVKEQGGKPFVIESGASAHEHGGLGFARWAFEVAEQEAALGVFFDTIFVPVASGGTLAGMIAGFKLAEQGRGDGLTRRRLVGIDTYNKPVGVLEATILDIARRTARILGMDASVIDAEDVILDTQYNAGQHSGWDHHAAHGVKMMGSLQGIVTDPIYSGRTMGAILHHAQTGQLDRSHHVLFVHTGGQPALGAFPEMR